MTSGANTVPTNIDTARLYNAFTGSGFTNSNVTVSTTTATCQKLQMKLLACKMTVLTGAHFTTTGSVEMQLGTTSELDIQAGATMDACTKTNTTTATFKLCDDAKATSTDTVNVDGTLNVVSQNSGNGTSELDICNVAGGTGTGTLNIHGTGVVNVDAYNIGTAGTGRIIITIGGTMTVSGDATAQVNADITAGRIAGASGSTASCTYNSGDGKTHITASSGPPPPPTPPAPPASITYPTGSSNGQYTVSWASSTGATSYQLERQDNGNGTWNQVYSNSGTSYSESVGNGSYLYRVKATNSVGSSAYTTGSSPCVVYIPPPASVSFAAGTAAGWDFHPVEGDIARNNIVDINDLAVLAQNWLANGCASGNNWCSGADLDASTGVDFVDYAIMAGNWGKQAGQNVLLQTIYGNAQDSAGNITANSGHAIQNLKGYAMAFNVPSNTALDKGTFKLNSAVAGKTMEVRLFNVTRKGYLTAGHTMSRSDPGTGSSALADVTVNIPSTVPYHTETTGTQKFTDMVINFGPLEITAGDYLLTFDCLYASSTSLTTACSMMYGTGTQPAGMGLYPDGTPLPKRATATSSAGQGNTYFYYLSTSTDANYKCIAQLFVFQIATTVVNHPPVVNAGANQTVEAPNAANLSGTASDDGNPNPPGVLTTTWSKFSGPGTVTFGDVHALNTTAVFSDIGTYVLLLTASDSQLSATSQVTIIYTNNTAPVVNAGADQTVGILDVTNLNGTVTDDGLPNPPGAVTQTWTVTSGPGTATFSDATVVNPTVTFSATGTYVLRLTASDSELSSYDEVTITVVAGSLNAAPVVNAGPDLVVAAPSTIATLNGTATDDGKPNPPGHLTITWTQQSGPGTVTFANPSVASTTATADTYGTYVLRLTADDSALQTYDEVTVTWKGFTYEGYDCNSCTSQTDLSTCKVHGLTTGGEGGTIVHVTNLSDSGAGSLRAALDGTSGSPTKIVFDVGGTIVLGANGLTLYHPYVTIAGETAPAPGITIDGGTNCVTADLTVNTSNCIVRNIRIRNQYGVREIIQVNGDYNIIIDHCSVSGGPDGAIDINNGTLAITVSWCIIADTSEAHRSYGTYASLHHNLYDSNNRRQPKIVTEGGIYDFRNNVVQNWTGTGTNIECCCPAQPLLCPHMVNIINNYYGPNGNGKTAGNEFHIDPNAYDIYIAGNVVPTGDPNINLLGDRTTPAQEPNVTTYPADTDLDALVRGHAGCMPRDAYDTAIAGPALP